MRKREHLADAVAIAALHALLCVLARSFGFDHVSDDDFSRLTIAQAFAHAPALDPSRTSWLPFPFWILGTGMAILGRSLAVAHGLSIVFASLAATTPYLALRGAGVQRGRALFATAFALGTPWCIWLGAAPVPESFTATLTAASAIGLAASSPNLRAAWPFAVAILAASLSRYEPWPVAAVLAVTLGVRAIRSADRRERISLAVLASLCALGPLAWMAWNAHAHDGPLHFFRRVSSFKRAIGEGSTDTVDALLLYPKLLFTTRPELTIPVVFLLVPALRDPEIRRRWGLPLLCAAAQIAFLAYGNARDGAPAHHPERAPLGTMVILGLFAGDAGLVKLRELVSDGRGLRDLRERVPRESRGLPARVAAACIAIAWVISSFRGYEPPGLSPSEDRREPIARGAKLRGAKALIVTPCAYEHFALIAAYGAPENVEIKPRAIAADGQCPHVEAQ